TGQGLGLYGAAARRRDTLAKPQTKKSERLRTSSAHPSSGSHRDRVALWQRHAAGATQRERPRAPCAIRPPRPAARSGWRSIRRGTGGWRPREMAGASQAASEGRLRGKPITSALAPWRRVSSASTFPFNTASPRARPKKVGAFSALGRAVPAARSSVLDGVAGRTPARPAHPDRRRPVPADAVSGCFVWLVDAPEDRATVRRAVTTTQRSLCGKSPAQSEQWYCWIGRQKIAAIPASASILPRCWH